MYPKLGLYRGRYVDINWGQFTDSIYTTRGRIFPEVGCPETKTDPDTRPIVGRYIDRLSADCRPTVDRLSTDISVEHRPTVDRYIASTNSKHVPFFL